MLDSEINFLAHDIQDFLGVKLGIKPCARLTMSIERFRILKKICDKHGIYCEYKEFDPKFGPSSKNDIMVYLSTHEGNIDKIYKADMAARLLDIGRLLGYPECCISFFGTFNNENDRSPFPLDISKRSRTCSFLINNLYNFDGNIRQKYSKKYELFSKKIGSIKRIRYITHIPCSYDCKESIRAAGVLRKEMKIECPELAARTDNILKGPVLYHNRFSWLTFEGKFRVRILKYNKVKKVGTLFPVSIREKIEKENEIRVYDKFLILGGNQKIKMKAKVIDFK